MNAASRISPGLPDYGVAKGALFYLRGDELGPTETVRADFPLPSTGGLGGTTVQVVIGGSTIDALVVAASARQVWAILPSSAPVGTGVVRVTYNGAVSAGASIQVVEAAFGIFLQSSTNFGTALAFNSGSELNQLVRTAVPGSELTLIGTGLGAISGDEASQTAVQDVAASVKVFVSGREADVISKGRLGLNEMANADLLKLPRGLAAVDQITFRVPDGVSGCAVPVSVQTGAVTSNWASLAVGDGGTCGDLSALGDFNALFGPEGLRMGSISLIRMAMSQEVPFLGTLSIKTDMGTASFFKTAIPGIPSAALQFSPVSIGNCIVVVGQLVDTDGTAEETPVDDLALDAGEALRVQGPKGSRTLKKAATGNYWGELGRGGLPSFPGLPGGGGGQEEFLEPGEYTVDNGAGGADVPSFQVKTRVGTPLTWTNQSAVTTIARSQDLNLTWTGGDAGSQVMIVGFSGTQAAQASFVCIADASAGRFTVPSRVLSSLPGTPVTAGLESVGGGIFLANVSGTRVEIPGTDISVFSSGVMTGKTVNYR